MHPVIAAFLDVRTAIDTLERGVAGIPMGMDEMAFVAAAKTHGELSAYVLQAKGREVPTDDSQNATILLAVRAALSRIPNDPVLAPQAKKAREALAAAGADPEQIEQLLGGVLVEEAFTGDTDPTRFDTAFVHESFGELVELAKLDSDKVEKLSAELIDKAKADVRPLYTAASEVLFSAAWGEGPQSINVEHVEDSLESLIGDDPAEIEPVKASLEALLKFLSAHKLIGPLRLARLLAQLKEWQPVDDEDQLDEGDEDEESEDDGDGDDEDEPDEDDDGSEDVTNEMSEDEVDKDDD